MSHFIINAQCMCSFCANIIPLFFWLTACSNLQYRSWVYFKPKVMNEVENRYVDEIEEHLCVKCAQKHFHEIEPWSKSHPLLFVSSNLRKTTSHLKDIMKIYIICLLSDTLFLIFFFQDPILNNFYVIFAMIS